MALILVTVQVMRPGRRHASHKMLGRLTVISVLVSLACAGWLTSELNSVRSYGGAWFQVGLYSMIVQVVGAALLGVRAARQGDFERHRIWMWRFAGGLWGSYWVFRAEMLLVDLLVRDVEGLTLSIPGLTSVPIGIAAAEYIRRRLDRRAGAPERTPGQPSDLMTVALRKVP